MRDCNDGADNDADGQPDLFDPGCVSEFDDDEVDAGVDQLRKLLFAA